MQAATFELSSSPIKMFPNSISKIYNLKTFRILYCLFLEEFPIEFAKLPSLRRFYIDDDEKPRNLMSMGTGQLTSLQTLPFLFWVKMKDVKSRSWGS